MVHKQLSESDCDEGPSQSRSRKYLSCPEGENESKYRGIGSFTSGRGCFKPGKIYLNQSEHLNTSGQLV